MDFVTVENFMWAIAVIGAIAILWRVITAPSRQAEADAALLAATRDGLDTRNFGPKAQAAMGHPQHMRRGDFDDDFDDDFEGEDLLDAIETVSNFANTIEEERHPNFPNVARDGLESEMAPTYDPPRESFHRSEPAAAPARESSGSSYDSDSSGGDSGGGDSGGGDD